jgi:hypothetical protein
MMNANDIIEELEKLEEKLRKGIREGTYFDDSYICGIADHLYRLQQKLKTNIS